MWVTFCNGGFKTQAEACGYRSCHNKLLLGEKAKPRCIAPYPGGCTGEVIDWMLFHYRAGSGGGDHLCISCKIAFGYLRLQRLPFAESFFYLFVG